MDIEIQEDGNVMNEKNFQIFDNIFRNENQIVSPLENPFIQHMLFDPYMEEERGNVPSLVADNFLKLTKFFIENYDNKGLFDSKEKTKIQNLEYLINNSLMFYKDSNAYEKMSYIANYFFDEKKKKI